MSALPAAARRLTALLVQENAALAAFELPRATALLAEKQAAAAAFAALAPPDAATLPDLQPLREAAEQNRRLLQRAMTVQRHVMGMLAAGLPNPGGPPRYAASGAPARTGRAVPFALSARA